MCWLMALLAELELSCKCSLALVTKWRVDIPIYVVFTSREHVNLYNTIFILRRFYKFIYCDKFYKFIYCDEFLPILNAQHQSVKFTVEKATDSLPFLDVEIKFD